MRKKKELKKGPTRTRSKNSTPASKASVSNTMFHGSFPYQHLLHHLNTPINIFDHRTNTFVFANNKFTELVGVTSEQLYAEDLSAITWIHPIDLGILTGPVAQQLETLFRKFIKNKSAQLTYTINFRLNGRNGIFPHVLGQNTVVEWDDRLNPAVILNLLTDISDHNVDHKLILSVKLFDDRKQKWDTVLTKEFLRTPEALSKRETEIVRLMVKGNTLEKISELLNISYHTSRKHCHNILSKTNCKSQEELKKMAMKEGWV